LNCFIFIKPGFGFYHLWLIKNRVIELHNNLAANLIDFDDAPRKKIAFFGWNRFFSDRRLFLKEIGNW
jgi:hypothetical protein